MILEKRYCVNICTCAHMRVETEGEIGRQKRRMCVRQTIYYDAGLYHNKIPNIFLTYQCFLFYSSKCISSKKWNKLKEIL